nr:MAG TPA: hypothetical protein [Crassvirales sp.]
MFSIFRNVNFLISRAGTLNSLMTLLCLVVNFLSVNILFHSFILYI